MIEIIGLFSFLWISFLALNFFQMALCATYALYFIIRTRWYFSAAYDRGVVDGYKYVMFGRSTHIKLYHILLIIWDLPMAAIGLFLPFIKRTLTFKLYEFKKEEKSKI